MQLLVVRKCLLDKTHTQTQAQNFHLALVELLYRMLARPKAFVNGVEFGCFSLVPLYEKGISDTVPLSRELSFGISEQKPPMIKLFIGLTPCGQLPSFCSCIYH